MRRKHLSTKSGSFLQHDFHRFGVQFEVAGVGHRDIAQDFDRRIFGFDLIANELAHHLQAMSGGGQKKFLLVAEVAVDRSLADPGQISDHLNVRIGVAFASKNFQSGFQNHSPLPLDSLRLISVLYHRFSDQPRLAINLSGIDQCTGNRFLLRRQNGPVRPFKSIAVRLPAARELIDCLDRRL